MSKKYYFNYRIPYQLIYNKLNENNNFKFINFFIDLPSIARGLYSQTTTHLEINHYLDTKQSPILMINELKDFLGEMYANFKRYNPKFIIFLESGKNLNTKSLDSSYKSDRSAKYDRIMEDEEREIHRSIKRYYYTKIEELFTKAKLSTVIYERNYEIDCLPYIAISKNIFHSKEPNTINIIMSSDKDLIQTTAFTNTYQVTSNYIKKQIKMAMWDRINGIGYMHANFKPGVLTSEYIPLILAIAGDKADNIKPVKENFATAKTISLLSNITIPPIFNENYTLPVILEPYKTQIVKNLNLTSFELQMRRIPEPDLKAIENKLRIIE